MYWTKRKPDKSGWWFYRYRVGSKTEVYLFKVDISNETHKKILSEEMLEWSSEPIEEPVDARDTCETCKWCVGQSGKTVFACIYDGGLRYSTGPCDFWEAQDECGGEEV